MRVLLCLMSLVGGAGAVNLLIFGEGGKAALKTTATPSKNGPKLPDYGMVGRLVYSRNDVFGCNAAVTSISTAFQKILLTSVGESPMVLLERSLPGADDACTFEDKVKAVQAAGASAAIIFDNVEEAPVSMYYEHPSDVNIPAVFISAEAGALLLANLEADAAFKPLTLLQAPPPPDSWMRTLQWEAISFTTAYLLLFMMVFPVAVVNIVRSVRRRRRVEAAYEAVVSDADLKARVERRLADRSPKALPLPKALPEAHQTWCMSCHRFLGLVVICFLWQFIFMEVDDADPTREGPADATGADPSTARSFGYVMVINSFAFAVAAVALEVLLSSLCRGLCDCRRRLGYGGAADEVEGAEEAATTTVTAAPGASSDQAAKERAKVEAADTNTTMTVEEGRLYVSLPAVAVDMGTVTLSEH